MIALVLGQIWEPLFWVGAGYHGLVLLLPTSRAGSASKREFHYFACGRCGIAIQEVTPTGEMGLGEEPLTRVSVFMNVFTATNRACIMPVTNVTYHHGKFLNASSTRRRSTTSAIHHDFRDDGLTIGITRLRAVARRSSVLSKKARN